MIEPRRIGRPPGACRVAVIAYLDVTCGGCRDIAALTGFTAKAVSNVIYKLRLERSPVLENLVDGRRRRLVAVTVERRQRVRRQHVRGPAETMVMSALRARTPLEEAWR